MVRPLGQRLLGCCLILIGEGRWRHQPDTPYTHRQELGGPSTSSPVDCAHNPPLWCSHAGRYIDMITVSHHAPVSVTVDRRPGDASSFLVVRCSALVTSRK